MRSRRRPGRRARPRVRFGFGRGGAAAAPATLETLSNTLIGAAMAMQGADVAPTAAEIAACDAGARRVA